MEHFFLFESFCRIKKIVTRYFFCVYLTLIFSRLFLRSGFESQLSSTDGVFWEKIRDIFRYSHIWVEIFKIFKHTFPPLNISVINPFQQQMIFNPSQVPTGEFQPHQNLADLLAFLYFLHTRKRRQFFAHKMQRKKNWNWTKTKWNVL